MTALSDLLIEKYVNWIIGEKKIRSQNQFAQWLGVSSASLSQWMNGTRDPVGENVHKLAESLGPEVYDALGLPRSLPNDVRMRYIADQWGKLSEPERDQIVEFVKGLEK